MAAAAAAPPPLSLRAELRKRLVEEMISGTSSGGCVVLVADTDSSKILSACCRMYDLTDAGVVVLEDLFMKRERMEKVPAIYFISPTEEAIMKVAEDFKDPMKNQYSEAHLFFTSCASDDVMNVIKRNKNLKVHVKAVKEKNINFVALEHRFFTLSGSSSRTLSNLFFPIADDVLTRELKRTARGICSVLMTLNDMPYIRYYGKSKQCQKLATYIDDELKRVVDRAKDWKPRAHGFLLIVDRSLDPVAPLMHEYTYQAMINDLLPVDGELCRINVDDGDAPKPAKQTSKDADDMNVVVLSEEDDLWVKLRHSHIGQVLSEVSSQFKSFVISNNTAQLQKKEDANLNDMVKAMKDMPKYRAMMRKYHKHMSLAQECMRIFDTARLREVGELEQDMATGLTESGDKVSQKDVNKKLVKMCQDPSVRLLEKLRLIMIYIISHGSLQESTRKELMSGISHRVQEAIRNLEKLGVDMSMAISKNKSRHSKERLAEFERRNKTIPLALMRYVPYVHSIFQSFVTNQLNEEDYPYLRPPPEGAFEEKTSRSARSKFLLCTCLPDCSLSLARLIVHCVYHP